MARWLKQSTAFTFRIGPFVDSTDGVTAETGLTIAQADLQISKAGGAFAQTSASPTTTHDADGWYQCPLTATDTNTLGSLTVQIVMAGALPVWEHFMVVTANVWDSMFGADVLQVDLLQIGGDAQSATDLKDFADAGYDPSTNKVQGVVLTDTVTTYTGNTPQTGDAFARLGATGSGLTSLASQASVNTIDDFLDTEVAAIKTVTDKLDDTLEDDAGTFRFTTNALEQAPTGGGAADGSGFTAIPWNAAWDAEVQSEVTDALNAYDPATRAEATADKDEILTVLGTPVGADVSTDIAAIKTDTAATLADTNELQTDWANGGRLDLILDARASQASVDAIDDFLDTEIAAILVDTSTTLDDFLDTEIADILADTNELQADWANGGRLDLLIDAIKAKTDSLTFTVANEVNANTRYINGTQLQGNGTVGSEWGPA